MHLSAAYNSCIARSHLDRSNAFSASRSSSPSPGSPSPAAQRTEPGVGSRWRTGGRQVAQVAAAVTGQDAPLADEQQGGKNLGFDTHTYPGRQDDARVEERARRAV